MPLPLEPASPSGAAEPDAPKPQLPEPEQPASDAPAASTPPREPAAPPPPRRSRTQSIGSWILTVLAGIAVAASVVGYWAHETLLDTDKFMAAVTPGR